MFIKPNHFFWSLFLSLTLFLPARGFSSDKSKAFVQKGYTFLTKKDFKNALSQFEAATKADSKDGEALFFRGVAFNRLGKSKEAAESLDQSKATGYQHPEWAFEKGWSHLGLGEWKEAIGSLKEFEKKNSGRGQTSEFIGRAYFGMGDYEKSEKYLGAAVEKDENLKGTVDYYRGQIAGAQAREKAPSPEEKEDKKWDVNVNLGGTFNTNAINLGNGATRPTNVSRQESGLGSTALLGSYRFDISGSSRLSVGHQFLSNFYEVTNRLNMLDNYSFLNFRHSFGESKALGITVSNEFTIIQTAKFRDQIGFQPVFGWRLTNWLVSELGYGFGFGEYFFPSNANQNRDGHSHTISLNNYFSVPKTKLRLRLGGSHLWNRADGADFDYQGHGLTFAATLPLFWNVTGELNFTQAWNRYPNINSLTTGTRRSDDVSNVFVQFNSPVIGKLNGYLRAGYTRNQSNIGTFNYRSQQGGMGFTMGL